MLQKFAILMMTQNETLNEIIIFHAGGVGWLLTVEVPSEYQEANGNWRQSKPTFVVLLNTTFYVKKDSNDRPLSPLVMG
jgi:hypothetical protein